MPDIKAIIGFGIVGIIVAWLSLEILRRSLFLLTKRAGALVFMGLALLRIALFAGGLVGAVMVGPWPLVTYLFCFVVTRTIIVSMARSGIEAKPAESEKEPEQVDENGK